MTSEKSNDDDVQILVIDNKTKQNRKKGSASEFEVVFLSFTACGMGEEVNRRNH